MEISDWIGSVCLEAGVDNVSKPSFLPSTEGYCKYHSCFGGSAKHCDHVCAFPSKNQGN